MPALKRMPRPQPSETWRDADTRRIARALKRALDRNAGGWFVAAESREISAATTITRMIAGREVVLWRSQDGPVAGPGACPHMGALLSGCPVLEGQAHCRWHGLPIGPGKSLGWASWPAVDDGVLTWVRLPVDGEKPTQAPALPPRPEIQNSITAVISRRGRCEPRDIIANRLDPWHGAWFHPYAFSHLTVDEAASDEDRLVVEVAYRVAGDWAVPVIADFTCPDARTIVMTIVAGEGAGSVVETHATPIGLDHEGEPVTVMTEATIAYSPRPGFRLARLFSPMIQAGMRQAAGQLWVDDLTYAERRYLLRSREAAG